VKVIQIIKRRPPGSCDTISGGGEEQKLSGKTCPRAPTGSKITRVASHLFTGGFVGIGKLPALFGWYIRYGIGIKWG